MTNMLDARKTNSEGMERNCHLIELGYPLQREILLYFHHILNDNLVSE